MPDFTTSLVAMIGLGVGIDYALFIVTRYREGLAEGLTVEEAVVDAVDTSGRAVIFAGITVIISLLGLFVMGLAFARGLAIGAVVGVLVMMLASVTLLPSLLAMVKHKIGVTTWSAIAALGAFIVGALFAVINEELIYLLLGVGACAATSHTARQKQKSSHSGIAGVVSFNVAHGLQHSALQQFCSFLLPRLPQFVWVLATTETLPSPPPCVALTTCWQRAVGLGSMDHSSSRCKVRQRNHPKHYKVLLTRSTTPTALRTHKACQLHKMEACHS
jgi:hypothetical protein